MTDRPGNMANNTAQTERIDSMLGQMRMLCAQIDEIGQEQQRLLEADRLEDFVAALSSRNPKIESLAQAGVLVEGFLDCDGVGGIGGDQVQSARRQLDEMAEVVAGILKRDAEQQVVVEKRRDELSRQLSGVGNSQKAVRAYSGGGHRPNPTLQDREG